MSAGECAGNLNTISQDRLWRQSRFCAHGEQRLALDEFHHDVELAVSLANFVNCADVGMRERRGSARLVEKTPAGRWIQTSILSNNFHGYIAVQHFVISAIDNPIPPSPIFANLGQYSWQLSWEDLCNGFAEQPL
jgi:hypothetical protein